MKLFEAIAELVVTQPEATEPLRAADNAVWLATTVHAGDHGSSA